MAEIKNGKMAKIVINDELCYGCRLCELACSYHFKGFFSPELSSIRVSKSNFTGINKVYIDTSCDSCEEEGQPMCVKYCFYGALREGA